MSKIEKAIEGNKKDFENDTVKLSEKDQLEIKMIEKELKQGYHFIIMLSEFCGLKEHWAEKLEDGSYLFHTWGFPPHCNEEYYYYYGKEECTNLYPFARHIYLLKKQIFLKNQIFFKRPPFQK
ncbi:MAG: hypothetical protein GF317_20000 [Candidatus Lokiarchaeota archaeon]|nr:hypothetical protein [Candidatus Lokiarchaeota archaeon]